MLQSLIRYSERRGLLARPGYAAKRARWAIDVNPAGKASVVEIGNLDTKKNPGELFRQAPNLSQPEIKAGGKGCRHFLLDNAAVVALLDGEGDDKLAAKHEYFAGLLRSASRVVPRLEPLATLMESDEEVARLRQKLVEAGAKPTDNVTFSFSTRRVVDEDDWHDWWDSFRRSLAKRPAGAGSDMLCLLSGEPAPPKLTHDKIKFLSDVGGLSMGDVLPAFKQDAFRSYGLTQAENAAMSEEMAKAYVVALNDLLDRNSKRFPGLKVVYWFEPRPGADEVEASRVEEVGEDLLDRLDSGSPLSEDDEATQEAGVETKIEKILDSIESGDLPAELAGARYSVLTLSANSGRVMVRDWNEGTLGQLKKSIDLWFKDLAITRRDGKGLAAPPKFWALLYAIVREQEDFHPPLVNKMWNAALTGQPIPEEARARLLERLRVDITTDQSLRHAALGLLRASINRDLRRSGAPEETWMPEALQEDRPSNAYHCGRLMAVLAYLQYRALGDVGAGVVQRYYGSASTTPALVLGRLVQLAQHHLTKLAKPDRGYFQNRIGSVMSRISEIPKTLNLEEKSEFALGYYHENAYRKPIVADDPADETDSETLEQETA